MVDWFGNFSTIPYRSFGDTMLVPTVARVHCLSPKLVYKTSQEGLRHWQCVIISLLRILGAGWGGVGYWGAGGGWVDWKKGETLRGLQIHRDVNPLQAVHTPDLPTYLVFYIETTHGSSIDPPTMDNDNNNNDDDDNEDELKHFNPFLPTRHKIFW
jgi:hypothetical protein